MLDIATLFSSKARTKVLQTLHLSHSPVALRHIALLADIPVYSVQQALKQLLQEQVIKKKKQSPYVLYFTNPDHASYDLLRDIFVLERKKRRQTTLKQRQQKARQALEFASSAQEFFYEVRS